MEPTRKEKTHRNDQIEQPALLIPVQEAFAFPLIRSATGLDLLGEGIDVHLDALQTLRERTPTPASASLWTMALDVRSSPVAFLIRTDSSRICALVRNGTAAAGAGGAACGR